MNVTSVAHVLLATSLTRDGVGLVISNPHGNDVHGRLTERPMVSDCKSDA